MALKRVGLDLGNFGVKVVSESKKNGVVEFTFESRTEKYDEDKYSLGGVKVLTFRGSKEDEYKETKVILQKGDFHHTKRKVDRKNLEECFYGALAQCCDDKDDVVVCVGLPAGQHRADSKEMKEKLQTLGNKVVVSYGDPHYEEVETKTINIKDVRVVPESFAAYVFLENLLREYAVSQIIMLDIGGRTTDLCVIERNIDGTVLPMNAKTLPLGTLKAYELLASKFSKLAQQKNIDYTFDTETAEKFVEKGYKIGDAYDFIDKEYYKNEVFKEVADRIETFVKIECEDYAKSLIVIVGGGGTKIGPYLKNGAFKGNSVIIDDIYCNAKGYLKLLQREYPDQEKTPSKLSPVTV